MVGWYHRLDGHEFEQAPGVGEWQGGLACCSSWGRKESDTTERLNNTTTLSLNKCREALGFGPVSRKSQPTILLLGRRQVSPLGGAQDKEQKEARQQVGAGVFGRKANMLFFFFMLFLSLGHHVDKNSSKIRFIFQISFNT